jgi:hypothetical protein
MEKTVEEILRRTQYFNTLKKHPLNHLDECIDSKDLKRFSRVFNRNKLEKDPEMFFKLAFLNLNYNQFQKRNDLDSRAEFIGELLKKKTQKKHKTAFYKEIKKRVDFVIEVIQSDYDFKMRGEESQLEAIKDLQESINYVIQNPDRTKVNFLELVVNENTDKLIDCFKNSNMFEKQQQSRFFFEVFEGLSHKAFMESMHREDLLLVLFKQYYDKSHPLTKIIERTQIVLKASKSAGNIDFTLKAWKVEAAAKTALEHLKNTAMTSTENINNVLMLGVVPTTENSKGIDLINSEHQQLSNRHQKGIKL